MLTVGLVYNLKKLNSINPIKEFFSNGVNPDTYLEWDEPATIEAIKNALSMESKVIPIEANESLWEKLNKYKKNIDIIFNIAEGVSGPWREAVVPIIAEELGIPYTGSNPATLVLCLDKQRTKEILAFYKIRFPSYKVFNEVPELVYPIYARKPSSCVQGLGEGGGNDNLSPLEFPLIVKPLWEGSSKGIRNSSLVIGVKECQNEIARIIQIYKQPALVEEFIPGREFTVGILGNGEDLLVLPIVELNISSLPPGSSPIYSYEAKWVWDVPEKPLDIFHCPAELNPGLEDKIKKIALNAFKALGCRDWCRIDIRLDKEENPYILELNPIPGIIPDPCNNSCLPKAAYVLGWDYKQLINTVLEIACERYGIRYERRVHSYNI